MKQLETNMKAVQLVLESIEEKIKPKDGHRNSKLIIRDHNWQSLEGCDFI